MRVGMAFGKFVILHSGHVHYLTRAKALVDRLIVVVASDETVRRAKGSVVVPAEQRREVVAALKPVDEAVVGDNADWYGIIVEKRPDMLILGPDQEADEKKIAHELKQRGLNPTIVRITELTNGKLHKTSRIIDRITSSAAGE